MKSPKASRIAVFFLSALFLGLVLGLVWAMALRENAARRMDLEFEAYRSSTIIVEEFLQDPESIGTDHSVLGIGIYSQRGEPVYIRGTAPANYRPDRPLLPRFFPSADGRSVVLIRPLGGEDGMVQMRGMMRGFTQLPPPPEGPPGDSPAARGGTPGQSQPRVLWLEFSSGARARAGLLTIGAAALVSLCIGGLYLVLAGLYRRNLDLLEREARNRELIQLGEAARTLAHEIKNPLAVIRIQTASMKREAKDSAITSDAVSERVLIIDEEIERITTLSDRIREFLKSGEGVSEVIDLDAFLEEFAARYEGRAEDAKAACLVLGQLPKGLHIRADPARLGQALDNVARNAFEACPEGPAVTLSAAIHGRAVEIAIEDKGQGVPTELEHRLFEPFFTTKEKGSGIGLALARRIAESAGGGLAYRKRAGCGACFVFTFPLATGS